MLTLMSFFDLTKDDYVAFAIGIIPIIFSLIMAKRYNVVHGIFSYLLSSYFVIYLLDVNFFDLMDKILPEMYRFTLYYYIGFIPLFICNLISMLPGTSILTNDYSNHIFLVIFVIMFVVSFIVSRIFRKRRLRKQLR